MYKTILRTLSALSILTITASAGFAQNEPPASVTTDVWKKGFGSPDKQPSISPKEIDDTINNQFLAPNADWADNADGTAHGKIDLNFDTTDDNVVNPTTLGTAVFYRGHNSSPNTYNHHAGILGNADLGAPLTETLGWVEWSGTIKAVGLYDIDKAFTLRVTFPGKIIAGIVRQKGDYHYKIDGNFNSKGVISGTVEYALFNTNVQGEFTSTAAGRVKGKLSGLIGENGALGVFHSHGGLSAGYAGYAGGFSATWDSRAHKGSLARCNSNTGDPFADNCESDGFKEHRELRLDYCITGGNAQTDPRKCHNATIFSSCVIDPFHSTCNEDNFSDLIKARLNRAKFCNNDANVRSVLCTEPRVVTGVCTDDPFNAICGTDYGPARISRCRTPQAADDCTATIVRVCSDDPFDPFCGDVYGSKRLEACREGKQKNNSCTAHVPVICGDNPFNALCEASSYDDARLEFCRDGRQKKDSDCSAGLVSMICGDNPFNTLCEADYGVERVELIKRCVGTSGDQTCMGAISTIDKCETKPFTDTQFCELDVFDTAREELVESCFGTRSDTTCAGAISTITDCEANPFSDTSLCQLNVFETARVDRVESCFGNRSDTTCTGAVSTITDCETNPFSNTSLCQLNVFETARVDRVESCVRNSGGANCTGAASTITDCETNPFSNTQFCRLDVFQTARVNLINRCTDDNTTNDTGCPAVTHVITACEANPFGANCGFDAFENRRVTLIDRCYADADGEGCTVITPVINDCKTNNPFGANCYFDVFKAARQALLKSCKNDSDDCTESMLTQPNAATWANSFKTGDNPKGLGILPDADTYDYDKPFLKKIESASHPDSGIEIYIDYTGGNTYKSLNLSTAEFNGTPLGGDAKDGVASFKGRDSGQEYDNEYVGHNWYAGIFSTTDLGAPVTDETGTASWVGSFYRVRDWGHHWSKDFVLEVNFDTQSIEAFVGRYYYLKGDYDANGVISGTVTRDEFTDNNRYKPTHRYSRFEATLTGLIGKEGAVGAYAINSYESGGFVARPADLVVDETTKKTAETFLNKTCTDDPFHEFCYLSDQRKERIRHCSMNDNAINTDTNIVNWDCMTDVESDSCIRHPFDEKCKPTATSHYETARENRSAFCKKDANVAHLFCIGAEQNALCLYDPFHTICSNAIYNNARKAVCKAGFDHPDCATEAYRPPLKNKVTAISWLAGLYKDDGVVPQTKPDTILPRNQFLQGTADGIDNGDVEIETNSRGEPYSGDLNLDTATFDGVELDGDVADGVAFFGDADYRYYAGIFSGTDLGEPLVKPTEEADMTVKWYGQFQVETWLKTDFTLDIKFNGKSTDGSVGTVEAFVHNDYRDWYHLLKGKFDANGVISGTVDWGTFPNHDQIASNLSDHVDILTGLIGAEGAVGVWIGLERFGGFVASPSVALDPDVKFSDWVRSFDKPPYPTLLENESQKTRFLQGEGTSLGVYTLHNAVRPANPLTLADIRTDGVIADGVGYLFGNQGPFNYETYSFDTTSTHHVAGILSGTNLGAVLPTEPADGNGDPITATWKGQLGLVANGILVAPRDIDLTVDFTNSKLKIIDSNISNTHFASFVNGKGAGDGIKWDNHGVLDGKINYRAASDGEDSKGTVKGLIGTDGAVAAFKSDEGSVTPYAGGFVAVPRDVYVQTVSFSDWVSSFSNMHRPFPYVWTTESQQARFLQGTETGLNTRYLRNAVPQTLTFADVNTDGEVADGVAYMSGTQGYRSQTTHHFAGILSGTNLGAVLDAPVTAAWDGKLGMIVDAVEVAHRDITLNINFARKSIEIAYIRAPSTHFVNFNGLSFDESGVITGEMAYNSGAALSPYNSFNSKGKVRGLIGQQGAVGAFISNHDNPISNASYAGGFVARPPAEPASP